MAKLPALYFYVGDWRKSLDVQSLSYHDKGVFFEILCFLHESEDRGKLIIKGKAVTDDGVFRLLGLDNQIGTTTLTSLLTSGVLERDPETGALTSRRMVRDEKLRKVRKEVGKLGGNPRLVNQIQTTTHNQIPEDESEDEDVHENGSSSVGSAEGELRNPENPHNLSPLGLRISGWFSRRPSTQWSDREIRELRKVEAFKTLEDDVLLLENRYLSGAPYIRKEILTLLNNWNGEIDRCKSQTNGHGATATDHSKGF